MKSVLCVVVLLCAIAAAAERQPLSRYQTIVDRQMFGPPPPGFDPSKPASEVAATSRSEQKELTKEQEKLQSSVQFSIINVTPEGDTAVGFSDNSDPKSPKHYYLKVGEERDGWLVKEANPVEASMTIAKGDIEVSLKIGENSSKDGATAKAETTSGGVGRRPGLMGGGLLGGGMHGLRGRRMQRQAEQQKRDEEEKAKREAKEAEQQAAAAAAAAEKAEQAAEREQQRQQLLAIQDELRKARERREQEKSESGNDDSNDNQ